MFFTSGAKYSGVPQNVFVLAPKYISSLHKPKSAILTWPSLSSNKFSSCKIKKSPSSSTFHPFSMQARVGHLFPNSTWDRQVTSVTLSNIRVNSNIHHKAVLYPWQFGAMAIHSSQNWFRWWLVFNDSTHNKDMGTDCQSGSLLEILQYWVQPVSRTETFNTQVRWLNLLLTGDMEPQSSRQKLIRNRTASRSRSNGRFRRYCNT